MLSTSRVAPERAPGESRAAPTFPGALFLRSALTPTLTLAYLLSYPRSWWGVGAFVGAALLLDVGNALSGDERRQPSMGAVGLDPVLWLLVALHWANLLLAAYRVAAHGWLTLQTVPTLFLLVQASALAGAVAGHELIHRRCRWRQLLGRLLLSSLLYEHFFTEHLRGHHARVGLHDDPSTARPDEPFWSFFVRTVPGQLGAAWQLERRRLAVRPLVVRLAGNQVLQGFVAELLICGLFFGLFGPVGLLVLLVQAALVNVTFQAVTYIEHWGLVRGPAEGATSPALCWDTDNASTLFSMLAASRHADHHANPNRPFYGLRHVPESPKLPAGYARMLWLAVCANTAFRRLMNAELRRQS